MWTPKRHIRNILELCFFQQILHAILPIITQLATAFLTFLGFGPMAVVIVAWSVPIASVLLLPEIVTGQSSELARTLVGRALGMLFSQ